MTIVTTIHGEMDDSQLVKLAGNAESENEIVHWVEYRLPGNDEIVHRSVHVHLKKAMVFAEPAIAGF
jgi:hypothetical protein